jgi:glycosyltransferase involved in cell wall biosynthesis
MKNLNFLIIGPLPDPIDGCSISNSTLCKNLEKRDIKFRTINTNTKVVSSNQGSEFSFKKAFSFLRVYFKMYLIFKSNVVYTTPGQTFFGVLKYSPFFLLCKFLRKPYIIHVHGNYLGLEYQSLKGLKKKIFYFLISSASRGIVLSESLRANFIGLLSNDRVFVVENFAGNELYDKFNPSLREKEKPVILFLSNLIAQKGIIDVLDAFIILKKANVNFKAYIAGKIEQEFESIINEKLQILGDFVEYKGIIYGEQKYQLLNKSNIFILPTYYKMEGQPISILEAMAMGNIIITTKHAGIPDVVSTKNGYFVEKKNPEDIARTLTDIAKDIQRQIENFESFNISYSKNNFTEELFSEKIIKIVNEIN